MNWNESLMYYQNGLHIVNREDKRENKPGLIN